MRALVNAAAAHPQVNARYDDEAGVLHRHAAVHVGIATQTEGGLMVPVVRHAEALDLWQSAAEIAPARGGGARRQGGARRADRLDDHDHQPRRARRHRRDAGDQPSRRWRSSASTASSSARSCVHGQIAIRKMMNLSSSFDHRIVDGWDAAAFIQRVKRALLEHPGDCCSIG